MTKYYKPQIKPFQPPKYLSNPLFQTIVPYYLPTGNSKPPIQRGVVDLEDGDRLLLAVSRPPGWKEGDRIVLLIHGLAGSEDSSYLLRICSKLYKKGYLVVRANLRSCGPGRGMASRPYHSGRSEDARAVLNWLAKNYPKSPISQIGFSLSANITLKMLGEDDSLIVPNLDSAMAISPPLNLRSSAEKITKNYFKIFNYFFLLRLKKDVADILVDFPQLPKVEWPKKMNLIDFDHLYTAPRSGFKDAFDYYDSVSSLQFVPQIKRKTLILLSLDDPIVDTTGLDKIKIPDSVDTIQLNTGGHVGFLEPKRFWMDETIIDWLGQL